MKIAAGYYRHTYKGVTYEISRTEQGEWYYQIQRTDGLPTAPPDDLYSKKRTATRAAEAEIDRRS